MMNKRTEIYPRMEGLDEAVIGSQFLDNYSNPTPKLPWMTKDNNPDHATAQGRSKTETTQNSAKKTETTNFSVSETKAGRGPLYQTRAINKAERSYKMKDDAKIRSYGKSASSDTTLHGRTQSILTLAKTSIQRQDIGHAVRSSQMGYRSTLIDPSTGLQLEYVQTKDCENPKARPCRPVSRQPVSRLMPGLRGSTSRNRCDVSRITGKVDPAFSGDTVLHIPGKITGNSVPGRLSSGSTCSETVAVKAQIQQTRHPEDASTSQLNKNTRPATDPTMSDNMTNKMKPYKKASDRQKANIITIVDEPTEARRKKLKSKANTSAKEIKSPIDNDDKSLSHTCKEKSDTLTVHDDTIQKFQKRYTKVKGSKELNQDQSHVEQEHACQRSTDKRENDTVSNINDDARGKKKKKRKHRIVDKQDEPVLAPRAISKTDNRKMQTSRETDNVGTNDEAKNRHQRRETGKPGSLKHYMENKIAPTKTKKGKNRIKYSKVHPIDDGSEHIRPDKKRLDDIATMFCVESHESAKKRRAKKSKERKVGHNYNDKRHLDKAAESKGDSEKKRALIQHRDQEKRRSNAIDDDDDDGNVRPGIWNCVVEFKKPTVNDKVSPVAPKPKSTEAIKYIQEEISMGMLKEPEEKRVDCISGIINIFRRVFRKN